MFGIAEFESSLIEAGKSKHTIKAYISDLNQFENWIKGTYGETELSPASITKLDVTHYRTYMMTVAKRKPSGINRSLSSISAYCDWAIENGLIENNPVSNVPQAQQIKTPPKSLNEQDLNRFLRAVYKENNKRDIAIIELMIGAGLRIGEVESLNASDIEVSERKGVVIVRQGKGGKYRQVPLNKDIRNALKDYLEERSNTDKATNEALFVSQKGGGLTSNAIWKLIKKYADKAGLSDITPHSLRHTFGTRLLRKYGTDIVTVAALMGHSNISTTAIYTKPNEQDLTDAVEKLSFTI